MTWELVTSRWQTAMCKTPFLFVGVPVVSGVCHISLTSVNMQFTFRMSISVVRADEDEVWGQSTLFCLMFKVVLIYQYSHSSPPGIITPILNEKFKPPQGCLLNVTQRVFEPAFRLSPLASKFHSPLCSCVFQTFLIGYWIWITEFG